MLAKSIIMDESFSNAVVASFNTWHFKREQPSNLTLLTEHVSYSLIQVVPIEFILYWGKGDRSVCGKAEEEAIMFLKDFSGQIKATYPAGAHFTFILTDTHAELNGYKSNDVNSYYESLKPLCSDIHANFQLLSALCPLTLEGIKSDALKLEVDKQLLASLVSMSSKHYKRDGDFLLAAKMYYLQNQKEKVAIEHQYPHGTFLTYNSSKLNSILPANLPIFYMYSLHQGTSRKPWFIE